jgi:hypothetical protein
MMMALACKTFTAGVRDGAMNIYVTLSGANKIAHSNCSSG